MRFPICPACGRGGFEAPNVYQCVCGARATPEIKLFWERMVAREDREVRRQERFYEILRPVKFVVRLLLWFALILFFIIIAPIFSLLGGAYTTLSYMDFFDHIWTKIFTLLGTFIIIFASIFFGRIWAWKKVNRELPSLEKPLVP